MSDIDLDRLDARAKAATPGPWEMHRYQHGSGRIFKDRSLIADVHGEGDREWFAALSPDVVTSLVAQAREAGRLREALRGLADKWASHSGLCCTFDEAGEVVVTPDSCRCHPPERAVHDVMGTFGTVLQMRAALAQPVPEPEVEG